MTNFLVIFQSTAMLVLTLVLIALANRLLRLHRAMVIELSKLKYSHTSTEFSRAVAAGTSISTEQKEAGSCSGN